MHEMSIAGAILDTAENAAGRGRKLVRIGMSLGPLSGVSPDSLTFCFAELASIRGLGNPALDIRLCPLQAHCTACDTQYEALGAEAGCPRCGSLARQLTGGYECHVESVTFEENEINDNI